MRDIKKVNGLRDWLYYIGLDIEAGKAEHAHISALNAMYNVLIGKRRKKR